MRLEPRDLPMQSIDPVALFNGMLRELLREREATRDKPVILAGVGFWLHHDMIQHSKPSRAWNNPAVCKALCEELVKGVPHGDA